MNQDLTFAQLRAANLARLPLFRNRAGGVAHSQPDGSDWNLAMWTNAVAGEVGEACNQAKKIERGDFGLPGSAGYIAACRDLARELADVIIYADIATFRCGELTDRTVLEKFNEVSDRVGCDVKILPSDR
jgi:NTP pyrophosphatase (non-canonical NTP hydrolase)